MRRKAPVKLKDPVIAEVAKDDTGKVPVIAEVAEDDTGKVPVIPEVADTGKEGSASASGARRRLVHKSSLKSVSCSPRTTRRVTWEVSLRPIRVCLPYAGPGAGEYLGGKRLDFDP